MKPIGCVFLILPLLQWTFANHPAALDYVLRSIEFLEDVHNGVFSCVFWDITESQTYDTIQHAVLESSRLASTTRYVVKGTHPNVLTGVPWSPSMLFIWAGDDVAYLKRNGTREVISSSLSLMDPWTKVVIFADLVNFKAAISIGNQVHNVRFRYFVIIDSTTMRVAQCNGFYDWLNLGPPHPMHLFNTRRRDMAGYTIKYVLNQNELPFAWNKHWLEEVVRHYNMGAAEYRHSCQGYGDGFFNCLVKQTGHKYPCDIIFTYFSPFAHDPRNTQELYTSIPLFGEIFVPRDRPLNVAELLMMPFDWQVWFLLITIFLMSELARLRFPELFKNDPTLLVVCGFERYNLHRAGRLEKTLFFSLIVLLFFMSNAFETKIVSLMVRKPSIQRIKTLDDLAKSDLKFQLDLENNPHFANYSLSGKIAVQGESPSMAETVPGVAMMWYSDVVELRKELAYDYERMQPFYVSFGYRYFHSLEMYWTVPRFIFLKAFIRIHLRLVEAGLIDFWKQAWIAKFRSDILGNRPRIDSNDRMDLNFGDMSLAWTSLIAGLTASGAVFLAEVIKRRLETWCSFSHDFQY